MSGSHPTSPITWLQQQNPPLIIPSCSKDNVQPYLNSAEPSTGSKLNLSNDSILSFPPFQYTHSLDFFDLFEPITSINLSTLTHGGTFTDNQVVPYAKFGVVAPTSTVKQSANLSTKASSECDCTTSIVSQTDSANERGSSLGTALTAPSSALNNMLQSSSSEETMTMIEQDAILLLSQRHNNTRTAECRGKNRKYIAPDNLNTHASEDNDIEDEEYESDAPASISIKSKRERALKSNRIAASKCREKKKAFASNLESRARRLTCQREALMTNVKALQDQIYALKESFLEHVDCNCEEIREYDEHDPSHPG